MRRTSKRGFLHLLALVCVIVILLWMFFYKQWRHVPQTEVAQQENGFSSLLQAHELGKGHVEVNVRLPPTVQFVHQSWKTAHLPPRFKRWSQSWRECFPKARHILWTDSDNRNFVAKHYPWFLDRYDKLGGIASNIQRTDSVRYLYMFHYGGVYTDLDNECLRPFEFLLTNTTMAFGAMRGRNNTAEGYVQNSFMYSVPRHPMWLELLLQILRSPKIGVPFNTGAEALANIINGYRKRLKDAANITVYPPTYFNPFSWHINEVKACKTFNKMTDSEVEACRQTFLETSFVVQYHAHTWDGGRTLK